MKGRTIPARPAAVKIVREGAVGLAEDAHALRQRFAREAQATAELQSPHTVQLFDFGMTDTGSFYYVMERLRGMDLQRMIERFGPLPPEIQETTVFSAGIPTAAARRDVAGAFIAHVRAPASAATIRACGMEPA